MLHIQRPETSHRLIHPQDKEKNTTQVSPVAYIVLTLKKGGFEEYF